MRNTLIILTILVTILVASSSSAMADSVAAVRGGIGVGGEIVVNNGEPTEVETSFGLEGLYAHGLHPNFAIGGALGFLSWVGESDEDIARNTFIDFSLRPEVHVPVHDKVDIIGAARFGLTYSIIGEDEGTIGGAVVSSIDPAFGFHFGVSVGARLYASDSAAVEFEIGYSAHDAEHTLETVLGDVELDGNVDQVMFRIGGAFVSRQM